MYRDLRVATRGKCNSENERRKKENTEHQSRRNVGIDKA
jgi:hypothetical protein